MKKKNIEDLFKDSFENFEAEVNPGIWSNIQTALKGVGIGLLGKALLNKIGTNTIIAVISSAAAVISTVVIMNIGGKHDKKETAVVKPEPKTTVIEKPKPAEPAEIKEFLSTENKKPLAETKPVIAEQPAQKVNTVVSKDKMNEVISKYSTMPVASISASPLGGTVPLVVNITNTGTGKINKWNFGDNKKETGNNPLHVYDTPGVYTIQLSSIAEDGKTAVDSVKVEVYGNSSIPSTPKEFTPNGDGNVDILSFKPINMVSMSVVVFNKNGKVYYKSDNLEAKWDGTDMKGVQAKEGVYFFLQTCVGVDGKKYEQKGTINLTR